MKVFVDTETSGLDPRHHSILSVCLGNKDIGYTSFHFRPNEDLIIDPKAMEVNNIDLDGIWVDQTYEFINFIHELKLKFGPLEPIGHNYQFDIGFIQQILGKVGYEKFFSRRYLDTMIIAKFLDEAKEAPQENYSLKALCERANYVNEYAHTAEGDVRATEAVYDYLVRSMKNDLCSEH